MATLNGSRIVSIRIVIPFRGVPFSDLDVDPEQVALIPSSGPAAIVIGEPPGPVINLLGVIDPLASGSFVATSRVRVLAGAGGWQQSVAAQHLHSPAGLTSTTVYNAAAAQVLEHVLDVVPSTLGTDFVLEAGPASNVFGDALWWVDPVTGITSVSSLGVRPVAVPDPSLEILEWDPLTKRATLACDALVLPGTPLADPRIGDGVVTVRDVEQTFDARGSRATAWCSSNTVSPLLESLKTLVRGLSGVTYLKVRRYRVVSAGPSSTSWALQAVDRGPLGQASPLPDLLPATMWTGLSGAVAKLLPSSEVLVGFVDGSPEQPVILGYSTAAQPIETTVDATAAAHLAPTAQLVDVGAGAASVAIAGGAEALVVGPWAAGLAAALGTFASSSSTWSTVADVKTAATALGTALGALPPPSTTRTKAT